MNWWQRWKQCRQAGKIGVVVLFDENTVSFFPRSKEGREIGREIRGAYRLDRSFPGGFVVEKKDVDYRTIYRLFNNNLEHPQLMINVMCGGQLIILDI